MSCNHKCAHKLNTCNVRAGEGGQCCGGSQQSINTMKAYINELVPRQYFFDPTSFWRLGQKLKKEFHSVFYSNDNKKICF